MLLGLTTSIVEQRCVELMSIPEISQPVWPYAPEFYKPDLGPMCASTCTNFPKDIPGMQPASVVPVLSRREVEYICSDRTKIPETGEKFKIKCGDDGFFEGETDKYATQRPLWPKCTTGCVDFPDITGFEPVSKKPLLPGATVTYQCAIRR